MEDEVDTPAPAPKDPGDICGPFVWPYSLLWKLTAPLTPVLTEDPFSDKLNLGLQQLSCAAEADKREYPEEGL